MNCTSILNNLAARSTELAIVIAVAITFGMASSSHAQTGAVERDRAPVSRQDSSLAGQSSSEQEGAKTDQGSSQSISDRTAPCQGASDQSNSSSSKAGAEQESTSCEQSAPEREGFFHKLIRILSGPNTPPGPNPDVDTNISAGGAAGG
jgi:hypothetical protein